MQLIEKSDPMKRAGTLFRITLFIVLFATVVSNMEAVEKKNLVLIETPQGNIKIRLYDETPKHRDNFLKLVRANFYDSLLFHRVIKDFMIQGGDPESKHAAPDSLLGAGGPGYTIPEEINLDIFHKRGALSAARLSDDVNPTKASSGSQFYVVWGKKYTKSELANMEGYKVEQAKKAYFYQLANTMKDTIQQMIKNNDKSGIQKLEEALIAKAEMEFHQHPEYGKFTDEQIKTYTTVGGTPFLDGDYTVFGEVVEGLDVVEKIQNCKTGEADKPIEEIRMKMRILE